MDIRMDSAQFDSLPPEAVGHACFEPMVPVYQEAMRGQNRQTATETRTMFYKSLTPGQRALLFFSYYDHAIQSADEFERISRYYLSAQIFGVAKKGIEYFRDDDMLRLLEKIESAAMRNAQEEMTELYTQFCKIAPHTLAGIGAYIKENPAEFVCLT